MSDHETQQAESGEPVDSEDSAEQPVNKPEAPLEAGKPVDDVPSDVSGVALAQPVRDAAPMRLVGPLVAIAAGAAIPFLIMCSDVHWTLSVPLGALGCLVAAAGILALVGSFPGTPRSVQQAQGQKLGARLTELVLAGTSHVVALRLAVAGVLPRPVAASAILVTATFFWLLISVFRTGQAIGAWRTDEAGDARGLLRRHGFWLVAITALLYLPMLGNYSLTDPWETHYGEVAREMLARDDWISPWWAQDGWFWSKPVLDFWIQGLAFSALGVRFMPDEMLSTVALGRFPEPEWAARMPIFLLTVLCGYLLYKGVARVFGRRAGFIGSLVLVTTPYWYFLAHQSMTDAPYVAPFVGGMGLMMIGLFAEPDARVREYEVRLGSIRIVVSAYHLLMGAILLSVLPQILYLLSRNLMLQIDASPHGFRPHLDEFFSGSGGGNDGLPGNEVKRDAVPVLPVLQPALMALVWSGVTGWFLWRTREERRASRLALIGAWWLVALSALAKGAPGLVIPVAVLAVFLGATKRWRDIENVEIVNLVLLVAVVTLPWYVQMYLRHGQPFTDRLLFHDMYKRAFVHVHDTNTGDDVSIGYYVWQLGYGLFPWTGLGAASLVWWLRRDNEFSSTRGAASGLLVLWFTVAFGMFTVSLTKFHHYVLPAVAPIAVLTGLMLDEWWPDRRPDGRQLARSWVAACVAACLLVYGALRLFGGSLSGALAWGGARPAPTIWVGVLLVGAGCVAWRLARVPSDVDDGSGEAFDGRILGSVVLAAVVVTLLVGRDLIGLKQNDPEGAKHLLDLFTYNYKRPWPASLDFSGVLSAFTVVCGAVLALAAVRRLRSHALRLFGACALAWTLWGLDMYFVAVAPHWGQRETVLEYYERRSGPNEPFVAYQMNWKGENFYTGNRVPAFVSSGEKFKKWIEDQKRNGVRVMFFTTEHGRVGGLKNELGHVQKFETITTKELNNKFVLARVEL